MSKKSGRASAWTIRTLCWRLSVTDKFGSMRKRSNLTTTRHSHLSPQQDKIDLKTARCGKMIGVAALPPA
jgi:hypothetical protein